VPQMKQRPSLWRGSLSPDGSLLAYQQDVLEPTVTVVDSRTGQVISRIRWEGDLSPLPIHIDPNNELVVIPLASWNAQFQYGPTQKLLLANLKTGQVLGNYTTPMSINHVQFRDEGILLVNHVNQLAHLAVGAPSIDWKPQEQVSGQLQFLQARGTTAGFYSRTSNEEPGQFRLLTTEGSTKPILLEKDFIPVGLQSRMLVSEKYTQPQLPAWVIKLNEYSIAWLGYYLVSPLIHELRFQDAITGEMLARHGFEQRNVINYAAHRYTGSTRLAIMQIEKDHVTVNLYDLFPRFTFSTILLLAVAATLGLTGIQTCWQAAHRQLTPPVA